MATLQELSTVASVGSNAIILLKQDEGAGLRDLQIRVSDFLSGYLTTALLGTGISQTPLLINNGSGEAAFPAVSGEFLTDLSLDTASDVTFGAVNLSDAIDSTSGVTGGLAATPKAVRDLGALKLNLTGGILSGNLALVDNSKLVLGTNSDYSMYFDNVDLLSDVTGGVTWKIRDSDNANTTRLSLDLSTGNLTTFGTISEGGSLLSAKYLGVNGKAADSNLLDGLDSTQFLAVGGNAVSSNYATNAGALDGLDSTQFLAVGGNAVSSNYATNAGALDGIDSTQFLRSDTTDIKSSGTLQFYDNVILSLGTGNDIEHYFNGTSYNTDINGGYNWLLRDGNSSNATRFTFDIDAGKLTATGNITAASFTEGGTALSSKYLGVSAKAADSQKLDNIDSSQFLRSDTSAIKTSGSLRFNDSVMLTLGSGNDIEHYWDGSNYLTDINGGGNWYLRDGNSGNATKFTFDIDTGVLTSTGNVAVSSDETIKDNFKKITDALSKVLDLTGYTYDRTDIEMPRQAGLKAQEVLKVLPEVVSKDSNDKYTVAYGSMISLIVEAIKELNDKLERLS